MTFANVTNNLIDILSNIINWLSMIAAALLNNYIFKIMLFIAIIIFISNLLYSILNKSAEKEIEEIKEISEEIEEDDDFWGDDE